MLAVGPEDFADFLAGGHAMDVHFREAEMAANLPVLLALVGIWHNQICGHATRAVLPYDQRLSRLPAYLQQLEMESNGKRVAMDGSDLAENSGPVVWGEPGHERAARLLPADPPGHAGGALRVHGRGEGA
jgi:glucose-6-phosphate isomerase